MIVQNEQGRTMLEMLGVLAIMGIITYGAIAGINYGMSSYKVTQAYNEVQEIIQGVEDLYSWSKAYPSSEDMMAAACQNDIFPQGCDEGNQTGKGVFGDIGILPDANNDFSISFSVANEDDRLRLETMDWNSVNIKVTRSGGGQRLNFSRNQVDFAH